MSTRRGYAAFGLTVAAFAWGVALLVAAFTVPVYGDGGTAVGVNGLDVLPAVAAPGLIAGGVWLALRRACTQGGEGPLWLAGTLVALLFAVSVLGVLSIGVFVFPMAVLLLVAAAITPRPTERA